MNDNMPFPRLVYGLLSFTTKVWTTIRKRPLFIILNLMPMGALMSGGYTLGLRKGYTDGYSYSLSASGLLDLSLNMGRLKYLAQGNEGSIKYSLELGVDMNLGDIFYGVALEPEPWYVNSNSEEEQVKREKSWRGQLEQTALYRREHPGRIIKPGDVVYQRLMEYLPTQEGDSLHSTKIQSP